jgi:hypothetical protein
MACSFHQHGSQLWNKFSSLFNFGSMLCSNFNALFFITRNGTNSIITITNHSVILLVVSVIVQLLFFFNLGLLLSS